METGNNVRLTPARLGRLLNWQAANFPIAGSETAKALRAGAIEIEACLVRHSTYEGANGVAPDLQRSGRKRRVLRGSPAPQAEHTSNRTVGIDTALSGRPFKASEREQVADDKAARFIGTHVSRDCRHRRPKTRDREQRTHSLRHIVDPQWRASPEFPAFTRSQAVGLRADHPTHTARWRSEEHTSELQSR